MKARKVVTRSGRGFRGYYPSKKLSRLVEFESILERDAIGLFEEAEEVVSYKEQPVLLHYYLDGEPKKYFPDFELILASEQIVHIEVKPAQKLANKAIAQKYSAVNDLYRTRAEHFVILTEKQIRSGIKEDIYELLNNDNIEMMKGANNAKIQF